MNHLVSFLSAVPGSIKGLVSRREILRSLAASGAGAALVQVVLTALSSLQADAPHIASNSVVAALLVGLAGLVADLLRRLEHGTPAIVTPVAPGPTSSLAIVPEPGRPTFSVAAPFLVDPGYYRGTAHASPPARAFVPSVEGLDPRAVPSGPVAGPPVASELTAATPIPIDDAPGGVSPGLGGSGGGSGDRGSPPGLIGD